jgi:hypothetical protein
VPAFFDGDGKPDPIGGSFPFFEMDVGGEEEAGIQDVQLVSSDSPCQVVQREGVAGGKIQFPEDYLVFCPFIAMYLDVCHCDEGRRRGARRDGVGEGILAIQELAGQPGREGCQAGQQQESDARNQLEGCKPKAAMSGCGNF